MCYARSVDGTSGRRMRDRWVRVTPASYRRKLSVCKKQDNYTKDADVVATEIHALQQNPPGTNLERQPTEQGNSTKSVRQSLVLYRNQGDMTDLASSALALV